MRGFDNASYGDGFADVYDDWYADVTDVEATVRLVRSLCPSASDASRPAVLELGVGTGRLAIPLAESGAHVVGVDTSAAMLARLATRAANVSVDAVLGDMVDDLPDGPFDVVLAAYNTFLNLLDLDRQRACLGAVASRLRAGAAFVIEAALPPDVDAGHEVGVRTMTVDRVILSISDHRPAESTTYGQFVDITEDHGVRLRPWALRWTSPAELDAMAADAGLVLETRHADMSGTPFGGDADRHVSVYRRATT